MIAGAALIQIFGTKKCKDSQKALRYFKERKIDHQFVDLNTKGLSLGELNNVLQFYTIDELISKASPEYIKRNYKYITFDKIKVALEVPLILKTPIIRYKKKVLLGFDKIKIESLLT